MSISDSLTKAKKLQKAGKYAEDLTILNNLTSQLQAKHKQEQIVCLNEESQCFWRLGKFPEAEA